MWIVGHSYELDFQRLFYLLFEGLVALLVHKLFFLSNKPLRGVDVQLMANDLGGDPYYVGVLPDECLDSS